MTETNDPKEMKEMIQGMMDRLAFEHLNTQLKANGVDLPAAIVASHKAGFKAGFEFAFRVMGKKNLFK